jgi:hypothetical protein
MVFKILKSSANFHGIAYNEKKVAKQSAGHLYHENFGYLQDKETISKEDFQNYLIKYSSSNERVKKPQFHATLSAKGKEHSFDELKEVALKMMYELGYSGNPILLYSHSDTGNNHIHIISSRVDMYGKKIRDNKEGIRGVAILNKILGIDHAIELEAAITYAKTYSCATHAQFAWLVESRGFKAAKSTEGYSFHKAGKKMGDLPFQEIKLENKAGIESKKRIQQIRAIFYKYKHKLGPGSGISNSPSNDLKKANTDFINYLRTHLKLEIVFFQSGDGKPYGYSIIDHQQKIVFKGSEIMPIEKLFERSTSRNDDPLLQKKEHNVLPDSLSYEMNSMPTNQQEGSVGSLVEAELSGMHAGDAGPLRRKKKKRKRLRL